MKRAYAIVVLIFFVLLTSTPLSSQGTSALEFWTSIRTTIAALIHGQPEIIVTEHSSEAPTVGVGNTQPGQSPIGLIQAQADAVVMRTPEPSLDRVTSPNKASQPIMLQVDDDIVQNCAAQARYVTTPGIYPVTIEWWMVGVNIDRVEWVFHDGTTADQITTQFTYTEIGVYAVILHCYGPLGVMTVTNSVQITGGRATETQVTPLTLTPTDLPTITATIFTSTPTLSPTPTLTPTVTLSPRPTLTPTATLSPTPTLTPSPGPSPTPTLTPTSTLSPPPTLTSTATATRAPVTVCVIGILPDPGNPLTYTLYLDGPVNVDEVVWEVEGMLLAGSRVTVTFSETGTHQIEMECTGAGGIVRRVVTVIVTSGTLITIGDGSGMFVTLTPSPFIPLTQPPPSPVATLTQPPPPVPADIPIPTVELPLPPAPPAVEVPPNIQPVEEAARLSTWHPISIGEGICIDWIAYHSNRVQEINIFRLGNLPEGESGDTNLSRGAGEGVYSLSPSISPDRQWVVFTSNRDGNMDIYISAVTHDDIRRLTTTPDAGEFNPVWSPNGRYIVFETDRNGSGELYLIDLATGLFSRLTWQTVQDLNASWSSDSTRLVFQSNRDGLWQIYELTIRTREVRRLTNSNANDYDPVYSPDGQQIAFRSTRNETQRNALYVMNVDGSNVTRISDAAPFAGNHSWSPNGSLIAYQSDLTGIPQIYIYEPESGMTRRVTGDVDTVNITASFAPTWYCNSSDVIIFTSEIESGISDIFASTTYPLAAGAINVALEAINLTASESEDGYPEGLAASNGSLGREVHSVIEYRYERMRQSP